MEKNLKLLKILSKLLKMLMNFKTVQNQTNNEATIKQKVNGNLKKRNNNKNIGKPSSQVDQLQKLEKRLPKKIKHKNWKNGFPRRTRTTKTF